MIFIGLIGERSIYLTLTYSLSPTPSYLVFPFEALLKNTIAKKNSNFVLPNAGIVCLENWNKIYS